MQALAIQERGLSTVLIGLLGLLTSLVVRWVLATLRPRNFVRPVLNTTTSTQIADILPHLQPPGPPVTPGLGNLLQIPVQKPYLKFHAWAKQYGDLVSLKAGTSNLVIINSPAIVHELFDKRGAIYSDRPEMYVLRNHIFYGPEDKAIAVLQYDDYYRRWRKAFQSILSAPGIARVMPLLEAEASNLAQAFAEGQPYKNSVRAWSLAVPLVATTGQRLSDLPKTFIDDFFQTQEDFLNLMVPGSAPPVDVFPVLKYVPEFVAKWKTKARRVRQTVLDDARAWYENGKAQRAQIERDAGSVPFEGLIARLLRERAHKPPGGSKDRPFTDLELGYIGQALVGAAVDTTSATFESLMFCFAAFPGTLRRAQREVDEVAGTETPPTAEHVNKLPYLKACLFEVLRWRPTTPSALPHTLTKDDRFGDYLFPKGTTFIANAWTIHRDEDDYDRPEAFLPDRFLQHPYGLRPARTSAPEVEEEMRGLGRRPLYAFGSGRRQCPGDQFALATILLAASKVVWAFDVLPPEGGVDISIETGYKDGTVTEPIDPTVLFALRDPARGDGLRGDFGRAGDVAKSILG